MKISIIGTGYVGLTSGACFAEVGHEVTCIDNDVRKVDSLRAGHIPIFEPGLEEIVRKNTANGRLKFTQHTGEGVQGADAVFIAVGTPPQNDGSVDMRFVETVAREIAEVIDHYMVIVDKSTVPVMTGDNVTQTIRRYAKPGVEFDVVSNPEFLREGSAVKDLMNPDRIVIGANTERAEAVMRGIYEPFGDYPIIVTDLNSAELIKHAANSFLALKISFINAISAICDRTNADVEAVAEGIGADARIGRAFLNAGIGYGGSCFPKDVSAFIAISRELGVPFSLLHDVVNINNAQLARFVDQIREKLWVISRKRIAVLGIAFKPNTDDIRCSVAVDLIRLLADEGAEVVVCDPKGVEQFKTHEPELAARVTIVDSAEKAVVGAEALVLATEWDEYLKLDFEQLKKKMRLPIIFDGRNSLDGEALIKAGWDYYCIGRAAALNRWNADGAAS